MIKNFLQEFKTFALKGNVVSMAIGVLVGVSFQGLVTSFTDNILSPIIGLFVNQNFDYLVLNLWGTTLRYGAFITTLINFFITVFIVFMMARIMNRLLALGKKADDVQTRTCPYCMSNVHLKATRCPACTSQLGDV